MYTINGIAPHVVAELVTDALGPADRKVVEGRRRTILQGQGKYGLQYYRVDYLGD